MIRMGKSLFAAFLYNTLFNELSIFKASIEVESTAKLRMTFCVELHEFLTTVKGR